MNRHQTAPDLSQLERVIILPLFEQHVDRTGHDPRSQYAETFWLPILGPSTLWLLRRTAARFDVEPDGFTMELEETSAALGIRTTGGKTSAFQRAMHRLVGFNMGRTVDEQTILVRRVMPSLHSGQVRRLSPGLQRLHESVMSRREEDRVEDMRRAADVGFTLLRLGDSPDLVEQQLVNWGVQPSTAHDAVNEAWARKAREGMQPTSLPAA